MEVFLRRLVQSENGQAKVKAEAEITKNSRPQGIENQGFNSFILTIKKEFGGQI